MSQTGFTPIQLYRTATPAAVPVDTDLAVGELAINYADGKLFYEDSTGVVQVIATKNAAAGIFTAPVTITTAQDALSITTATASAANPQLLLSDNGVVGLVTTTASGVMRLGLRSAHTLQWSTNDMVRISVTSGGNTVINPLNASGALATDALEIYDTTAGGNILALYDTAGVGAGRGSRLALGGISADAGPTFSAFAGVSGLKNNGTQSNQAGYLVLETNNGTTGLFEVARCTSTGNLLVGTTTDRGGKVSISGRIDFGSNNTFYGYIDHDAVSTGANIYNHSDSGGHIWQKGGVDQAQITSGGSFLIGKSVPALGTAGAGFVKTANGAYAEVVEGTNGIACAYFNQTFGSGTQTAVDLRFNGTQVGTINVTSTTTSYNTTSDYRLKDVVGSITNAGERIDALKPVVYVWKINGQTTRGFLAHEFQSVYPDSVSGEKDAVDEEGNEKYQTMQASSSEVIADLVAETQTLRLRVAALEAQ